MRRRSDAADDEVRGARPRPASAPWSEMPRGVARSAVTRRYRASRGANAVVRHPGAEVDTSATGANERPSRDVLMR